jgi:hypothetical protein
VVHARLRDGNSNTARGAASFLAETLARARGADATGPLSLRADAGFYSRHVVEGCQRANAFISDQIVPKEPLDVDHCRHAVVENAIRDLKYRVGLNHLPSGRFGANAAWLALNVIAHNMSRFSARIGGLDLTDVTEAHDGPAALSGTAEPTRAARKSFVATDTLRRHHLAMPGRITRSGRQATQKCSLSTQRGLLAKPSTRSVVPRRFLLKLERFSAMP